MARFFTFSEIKEGRIPTMDAFPKVAKLIREKLSNAKEVQAATIYGSTLLNKHSLRSDIDCFLVYERIDFMEVMALLKEINLEAAKRFVPIEFVPVDRLAILHGFDRAEPNYVEHLSFAAVLGGAVKGNSLEFFSDRPEPDRGKACLNFLSYHLAKLQKYQVAFDRGLPENLVTIILQDIFQAPVHAARTVLWAHNAMPETLDKASIVGCYEKFAKGMKGDLLKKLVRLDENYTHDLVEYQKKPEAIRYETMLRRLTAHGLVESIRFLWQNSMALQQGGFEKAHIL